MARGSLPAGASRRTEPGSLHLEGLLRCLPSGLAVLDAEGRIAVWSDALAALSRRAASDVEGRDFFGDVAPWAEGPAVGDAFRRAQQDGTPLELDTELVLSSGGRSVDVRVRLRGVVLEGRAWTIILVDDATRLKSAERAMAQALSEAQDQAIRDPLTGLFNRRYVESVLAGELSRARRYGVPVSILAVDVDHFKSVNDRFGHPVGDQVLIRITEVMGRMRRVSDTCARLGGEEFCVLLPHTPLTAAVAAGERLRRVVKALRFEDEPELRVTVSVGVSSTPPDMPATEFEAQGRELLARADGALYEAKRTGRDRVVGR